MRNLIGKHMIINHLSLTNFRNFGRVEIDLQTGPTILHGANAQGKTNLIEALYYLATTRSPRVDFDAQLINWDAGSPEDKIVVGRIVAHLSTAEGTRHLEMRLIRSQENGKQSFRREVLIDRRRVRLMDLIGVLRVVLFLPEDINLITGSPAARRRYIDITLCQSSRTYCRTLSRYNKVLDQRNAQLRQMSEFGSSASRLSMLAIYSEKLADLGSTIFLRRASFLAELGRELKRVHYEQLTGGRETIELGYLPRLQDGARSRGGDVSHLVQESEWLLAHNGDTAAAKAHYMQALEASQAQDIARGTTSRGPHRDDWRFWLNGRHLTTFGSRGQQRTVLLALKMAEINWVSAETKDTPILLLDDVMAELDHERRHALSHHISTLKQSIITTTDMAVFAPAILENSTIYQVTSGQISPTVIQTLT